MKALASAIRRKIREVTQIATEEVTSIDELSEFFADADKSKPNRNEKTSPDPENFIYKPKKRLRKQVVMPSEDKGKEGGAGRMKRGKGGKGKGTGEGTGNGTGGTGNRGKRTSVNLSDERNLFSNVDDLRCRAIFFTPDQSCEARLIVNAPGMNSIEELRLISTSKGNLSGGRLEINLKQGEREKIDVVFTEPYGGPIDIIALAQQSETA